MLSNTSSWSPLPSAVTPSTAAKSTTQPHVHKLNRRQQLRTLPIHQAAGQSLAAGIQQHSAVAHVPDSQLLPWQEQQQQRLHAALPPASYLRHSSANRVQAAHKSSSSSGSSNKLDELLQLLKSRPPSSHPALLTAAIRSTTTWQQAAAVFATYSHDFNNIHTAAFISHLPKVLRSCDTQMHPPSSDLVSLLEDVSVLAEDVLPHCSDREMVNIAQGLASIRFYNRRLLQLLLCRCDLSALNPQELAGITWAVAKMGHEVHEGWVQQVIDISRGFLKDTAAAAAAAAVPSAAASRGAGAAVDRAAAAAESASGISTGLQEGITLPQQQQQQQQQRALHGPGFKPQELCNLVWGLAVMQRRCLLFSSPPLRYRCTVVDVDWKMQLCAAAAAAVQQYNAADVAMCLWGVAVLGFSRVQNSWLQVLLGRACDQVHNMEGRHIAVVLWATSRLLRGQQQQQQQLCSSTAAGCDVSNLEKFTGLCYPALQKLISSPGRERQQQQQRSQLRLSCVVLLSTAHLGVKPPAAVMAALLAAAAAQLNLWRSRQRQQQQWDATSSSSSGGGGDVWHQWSNVPQHKQQQRQQHQVTVHDVTMLLFGAARLSYRPSRSFMAAALAAAAAATWQQGVAPGIARRAGQQGLAATAAAPLQGKELSMLLWSLAKLHYKPSSAFLQLCSRAAVEQLNRFSTRDIAVMLWALSRMHHAPKFKWVRRMLRHFLSRLDDSINTAPDICQMINALPQLPSAEAKNLHRILLSEISDLLPELAAAAAVRFSECRPRELVGMVQGFARLGFYPGVFWQQQHSQRSQQLLNQGVRFSEAEQQVLEHSRTILDTLAQQQQQHRRQLLGDRQTALEVPLQTPQLAGV